MVFQEEFKQISILGEGQFGVVLKATKIQDNQVYAVKRVQLNKDMDSDERKLENEIEILRKLSNCPQVIRFYDAWYESSDFMSQAQQDRELNIKGLYNTNPLRLCYIQMEHCNKTLKEWLESRDHLNKVESLNIFKQIIEGLAYIHKQDIVHHDIKPSNVLLTITNGYVRVRISDFGFSICLKNLSTSYLNGTPLYMAPEILLNKADLKSDMFSAGLILIELLCNCSANQNDMLYKARGKEFPKSFQNELKFALSTLEKLLSEELTERPSSAELLHNLSTHPDWNDDLNSTVTCQALQQQNEWKIVSNCTTNEHKVDQLSAWTSSSTLSCNYDEKSTDWIFLPAIANSKTEWGVHFLLSKDNFAVGVRCKSLDNRFRAASFRLFAFVENLPEVWMEIAAVLKSGEASGWWYYFPKKVSELPKIKPIKVRVRIQWTELEKLSPTPDLWRNGDACIECHWQLHGWNAVSPTSDNEWRLYSEAFGQGGAIWRIIVMNCPDGNDRMLQVRVELQHLPTSIDSSRLSMCCSLSLWNVSYDEQTECMQEESYCEWTVIDAVKSESLDLTAIICITRD